MHYYQFNIGDYASHTRHLSIIEDIAYRRLLDLYYLHERPLGDCSANVARLIGMSAYQQEVETVLIEYFEHVDGGYINIRADKEIAHYHSKIEQASKAGKASAERRSNSRSTDVQPTNNQEPITNNHIYTDFEKVLKAKNKTLTETLIASIQSESAKANMTIDQAIKICCERGWSTFKAEWVLPKVDIIHQTVPSKAGRDPTLVKLENDAKNAVAMPDDVKAKFKMIKNNA